MCAIAGIMGALENRNKILYKMMECMFSRGPDNQGDFFDSEIALGHRRLKIIDLSDQGNQPILNEEDSLLIVFNGEIYNFIELRKQLEGLGHRFKSRTDTEVILHSYEEWGKDCLAQLRGMFAFAIWDKSKKELFLARDRLGIKPLYYYFKGGVFIFASQVRALLASEVVPKVLNPSGLFSYLDCGGLKEPQTIIENVYSLLPGHYMVLNKEGFRIAKYWDLLEISLAGSQSKIDGLIQKTNALLKETMRLHLVSDVPLGIFLSGGVDSASLLSLARGASRRIKTVSFVFEENSFSEGSYSRELAKEYDSEHKEILFKEKDLLKKLSPAISAMDEPTFDGINTYFISQAAHEAGLTVVLSGLGGDEVFAGYSTFKRTSRISWLVKFLDKSPGSIKNISTNLLKNCVFPMRQRDKILELVQGKVGNEHPYFWLRRLFTLEQKNSLLKLSAAIPSVNTKEIKGLDAVNQVSFLELTNYLRDILLRDSDFMSMAHSLELRVPFLDHKLVEFMSIVPGRFKISSRINKPLLANSLDSPLPDRIRRRKKMGFVLPFDYWLRRDLKNEVEATLLENDTSLKGFLNHDAVSETWFNFKKGRLSWQRPWALFVLKKWVNSHLA